MTTEQKAKAYDEVVNKLRRFMEQGVNPLITRADVQDFFPELRESEGERVLKIIKETLKSYNSGVIFGSLSAKDYADCLAWIEKQGEQNNILNWSEDDERMLQSLEHIVKDFWAKAEEEKNEIKIKEASDVSYFLKTIQKSPLCWIKCSDGLPNRDGTYLVVTDGKHNEVYDIARYDSIKGWHKASEIIYWMPIPQLNKGSILEQEGYSADAKIVRERLKLMNGEKVAMATMDEQKPAEWSEEDEEEFQIAIDTLIEAGQHDSAHWLKSLKPQPHWKPTDEQMADLWNMVCECRPAYQQLLQDIYYGLKTLKEE